jgi:transcriptional regulator with XRE-family HTH domain
MDRIVENIKKLRTERNLTQQDIAEVINMHRSNYSKIEKGGRELSISALIQLADFFNVSLDELVLGNNPLAREIKINDKSVIQQIQLIQELDEEDRQVVYRVIEALVSKKKFRTFFKEELE